MKPPSLMSGEELRNEGRRADRRLGAELDRLRLSDSGFKAVLDRALEIESEIERRRKPPAS